MASALDVVRRHRMEGAFTLFVAVLVGAMCATLPSNAWMSASVGVLAITASIDLSIARWLSTSSETETLRRERRAMRWSLVWYVLPMVSAPLLLVEGVSRLLGEHAPVPIVVAVLAVGVGAGVVQGFYVRQLDRQVSAVG